MKKLITSASKIFKLSFVMIALASVPAFAGGDDIAKVKLSDSESYAQALKEMAAVLDEQEEFQNIYASGPKIEIYDANFNLVKEAEFSKDGNVQDEQILSLMQQATEFVRFENTIYYILNN